MTSYEVIVNLIASTSTTKGLKVQAAIDTNVYDVGIKVTDDEFNQLKTTPAKFHRDWNYIIKPRP